MNSGKREPLAVPMPDPPGPPARYTIGGPGFLAVLLKRTKASSIKLLSGSERFSGTNKVPNSASVFSFLLVSNVYGLILRVPAFCWPQVVVVRKSINKTHFEIDIRDASFMNRFLVAD